MNLDLNNRQRAMLNEMGVHLWWPEAAAARPFDAHLAVPASAPQNTTKNIASNALTARAVCQNKIYSEAASGAGATSATPPPSPAAAPRLEPASSAVVSARPRLGPTVLLPLPAGIADMDWPGLRAAVAQCQACSMCLGRQAPVLAAPLLALQADWLVVGEPPDDAQERAGTPFVDDAGKLLDNMLRAVKVQRFQPGTGFKQLPAGVSEPAPNQTAYLTHVLKCRPALPGPPDTQALLACAHYLKREIALVRPKVILTMGRLAMQVLLSEDHPQGLKLPLGKLRAQVWHYQGVPVVVTYPPSHLLHSGLDKARAWEDLCLALDVVQGQPPK